MDNITDASNEDSIMGKIEQKKKQFWDFLSIGYFTLISFIGVKTGVFLYKIIFLKK